MQQDEQKAKQEEDKKAAAVRERAATGGSAVKMSKEQQAINLAESDALAKKEGRDMTREELMGLGSVRQLLKASFLLSSRSCSAWLVTP